MTLDPRRLVTEVAVDHLAEALAVGSPTDFYADRAGAYLRCPRCRHRNGPPTARIDESERWRCHRCNGLGNRYELERLVLEDPAALGCLLALIEGGGQ